MNGKYHGFVCEVSMAALVKRLDQLYQTPGGFKIIGFSCGCRPDGEPEAMALYEWGHPYETK